MFRLWDYIVNDKQKLYLWSIENANAVNRARWMNVKKTGYIWTSKLEVYQNCEKVYWLCYYVVFTLYYLNCILFYGPLVFNNMSVFGIVVLWA